MANTYQVAAESLKEGSIILVRGKLGFARLTRLIEGEELRAVDARRVQNNLSPVGKPHTTVTVTEAEVIFKDAAAPTLEERFVEERRYTPKKNPSTGLSYSVDSKGQSLPIIAIPTPEGTVVQDESGQELAQGLDVTLVLRVYKPKTFNKRGIAIDQVIVNEPVRYYSGNTSVEELAQRGIVFAAPPQAIQARSGAPAVAGQARVGVDNQGTIIDENGFALPAPGGGMPQAAPAAAPQVIVQAPAAPVAPVAQPVAQAAPVPTAPAESLEAQLARLQAENAALKDAGSAIGAPAGAPASPWADDAGDAQGITYQG